MTSQDGTDPSASNSLRPLRELLSSMDAQIALVYSQRGVTAVRPRFSMALIRLHRRGPLTVKELAEQVEVTHSAMSQTLTAMRRDGLVESAPGVDARTRTVSLTDEGRRLVPFLEAEWRATEAAWAELEDEVPYALAQVVADLEAALERRSFADRIARHLDQLLPPTSGTTDPDGAAHAVDPGNRLDRGTADAGIQSSTSNR